MRNSFTAGEWGGVGGGGTTNYSSLLKGQSLQTKEVGHFFFTQGSTASSSSLPLCLVSYCSICYVLLRLVLASIVSCTLRGPETEFFAMVGLLNGLHIDTLLDVLMKQILARFLLPQALFSHSLHFYKMKL